MGAWWFHLGSMLCLAEDSFCFYILKIPVAVCFPVLVLICLVQYFVYKPWWVYPKSYQPWDWALKPFDVRVLCSFRLDKFNVVHLRYQRCVSDTFNWTPVVNHKSTIQHLYLPTDQWHNITLSRTFRVNYWHAYFTCSILIVLIRWGCF